MILLYGNLYIIFLVVAWYSELQEALTCCGNNAIASCLKQHHGTRQLHSSSIRLHHYNPVTLVSYDNTDTIDYAVYAFAINSMFAFHRNYTIFATSSAGGFEYENRDQRWNKVKIIHTMLEDLVNRNISDKLIIWMDSDLIVLNFELDFLALSRSNLLADVIVSRDVEPLNGMINTGCMIVRSTPWALAFFDEWWNSTDRVNGMDQHVFDLVYRRRLNDIHCNKTNDSQSISDSAQCVATKIAILAPHALNSQIPARKHQEENHKVLHLAGESSIVRTHIFKLAFSDLCRAITCSCNEYDIADTTSSVNGCLDHDYSSRCYVNVSALAPQLGITRQVLRGMDYAALLIQEVQSILTSMSLCGGMPSGGRGDGDISIDQEGGAAAVVLKNLNCDFSTIVKVNLCELCIFLFFYILFRLFCAS